MKELSIVEKAKAYDEAKLRMSRAFNSNRCSIDFMDEIFPELKESEDEKIVKELLAFFRECVHGGHILTNKEYDSWIAWLEKQGEHAKFRDSIQVGDKVTRNEDGVLVNLSQLKRVAKKDEKQGKQNLVNTDLDELVIQLEETIGTSPHSRETIKDFFQMAIQKYMNCLRIANGEIGRLVDENYWLKEKLGEQKPSIEMITPEESLGISSEEYNKIVDECIYGEQKPADKVEPKFKIGDWIVNNEYKHIVQVLGINNEQYTYRLDYGDTFGTIIISLIDNDYHLWTIQDAKDGDVLMANAPFIFNGNLEGGIGCPGAHCGINTLGEFQIPEYPEHWTDHTTTPATKEQRDKLEKAMADAGYTFDFEKKELKKIVVPIFHIGDRVRYKGHACDGVITEITDTDYICGNAKLPISTQDKLELVEQKSSWSEEDEKMFNKLLAVVGLYYGYSGNVLDKQSCTFFLKSLKDKCLPQSKQEWSEEDDNCLSTIIAEFSKCAGKSVSKDEWMRCNDFLNSLKDRYTWKPSEEQIKGIECAIITLRSQLNIGDKRLNSLYEQLKAL